MKLKSMKYLLIIIITFMSCKPKESILITGFAHKNDNISILDEKNRIVYNLIVNTDFNSFSNLYVLYEETKIYKKNKDFNLRITLDSNNIRLIDTIVIINKENIKPFILFADPKDVGFKRKIFIDDDSKYIK